MNTGTILIVDDNKGVLASLELLLENYFSKILTASNPNQITALLTTRRIDVVILDMNFSAGINNGNEGLYWLGHIRQMAPTLPVVMLTAYGDVELAVKALKNGAADFLLKPWNNQTLIDKVTEAYRSRKAPERTAKVDRAEGFEMLVRSLVWSGRGRLPSSSMNSELPLAASNFPGRLSWASVKAPRSCPNSSLSNSDSLMAPISTFSIGRAPRGERRCISRASISLPVPFSPVIRMLASVRATFDTTFISCNMAGERPTSISNPSALSTFAVRSDAERRYGGHQRVAVRK